MVTGDLDVLFCPEGAAACPETLERTRDLFPLDNFSTMTPRDVGHSLTLHLSAPEVINGVHEWLDNFFLDQMKMSGNGSGETRSIPPIPTSPPHVSLRDPTVILPTRCWGPEWEAGRHGGCHANVPRFQDPRATSLPTYLLTHFPASHAIFCLP